MIGRILRNRYKIDQELGRGSFGITYLATDLDFPDQRKCVVKLLSPRQTDPQSLAIAKRLFESEAKSLASLGNKSEQIPRLYAYFEEGEGQFFLVQEFVNGHDLRQELVLGKKWQEEDVIKLLREILEILSLVHQKHKIHRDIKPANIMRSQDDGKLMLIDFGAVKDVVNVNQQGIDHTIRIGTTGYLPPEQAMGNPRKSSDIYAVGMIGVQALTGCDPIELDVNSSSLDKIFNDNQVKVSSKTTAALDRMTRFDRNERYQNAAEALKEFTVTEPTGKRLKVIVAFTIISTMALLGAASGIKTLIDRPSYVLLTKYLTSQDWQSADLETDKLLLKAGGQKNALDAESISRLSCKTLQKIDQLWTDNSNQRFGFTPQKDAYLAAGNNFEQFTQSTYEEFGNKVRWRFFGVWSLYGDLKFTMKAPYGHLPSPAKVSPEKSNLRFLEREMLLSRFNDCS